MFCEYFIKLIKIRYKLKDLSKKGCFIQLNCYVSHELLRKFLAYATFI